MSYVSDFFRKGRYDYLGAVDRDWISRTAKYYNSTNPPTFPLDESRIRARENILIKQMKAENYQYAKNAYSLTYLKSIPINIVEGLIGKRTYQNVFELGYDPMFDPTFTPKLQTDEQYYGKFQTEMGHIVSLVLFSALNSTDQSIWYEWLLRMDRGRENDRDMFLGIVDRGSIIDIARVTTEIAGVATAVTAVAAFGVAIASAAAPSAAVGAAAEASTVAAASGAAIEGGTIAGSVGLLGEGVTVAGFAEAGAAATTAASSGGLFSGLGAAVTAAQTALGAAAISEGQKYVQELLQPKKDVPKAQVVVDTQEIAKNNVSAPILLGAGFLTLLYFLI